MMDITIVDDKLRNAVISYAENCSWRAGKELARLMRRNEFKDWEKVFAVCENGRIAGFCTLTGKDELSPEYPFTPFIGFVFVDEEFRGKRVSGELIGAAVRYAHKIGFENVYIMSGEVGLYEKYCFSKIGDFETIYGGTEQLFVISMANGKGGHND